MYLVDIGVYKNQTFYMHFTPFWLQLITIS